MQVIPSIQESKVLNPEVHARLIQDIDNVAAVAGIPQHMIWTQMNDHCSKEEVEWVKDFRKHITDGEAGLVYLDHFKTPVEIRMMSIAGALIRNYIDARVMPVQDVLNRLKNDTMPTPTLLMIPNFFIAKSAGGQIPNWQISSLLGLLISRYSKGLLTALYVQDEKTIVKEYGDPIAAHIFSYYHQLKDL